MPATDNDTEVASEIVKLLPHLRPDNALRCEVVLPHPWILGRGFTNSVQAFLSALQDFINRGGVEVHDVLLLVGHTSEPPQKRKRESDTSAIDKQIQYSFKDCVRQRPEQSHGASLVELTRVLTSIESSCKTSKGFHELFRHAAGDEIELCNGQTLPNRQKSAINRLSEGDQKSFELRGVRRLRLLRSSTRSRDLKGLDLTFNDTIVSHWWVGHAARHIYPKTFAMSGRASLVFHQCSFS